MSAALIKGLTHLVFWSGMGYMLMQVVTPSDDEIRKKLPGGQNSASSDPSHNKLVMEAMKRSAGVKDK
ncbi:hypothetical protein FJT64_025808 [Amphibalanus amphitrite]|uniref:Ubiquinol-cytochrome-c reductase complex assembly factor 3 n=1 Tax=Amphibalanus amphitrite TaxID=1232801 RepID=A0A6A4W465_AMPAM|nr:hypothetical protein FJT64_012721 [Amphibalanus amphitrite]KAF0302096.1 hypothetical protein FJT64_025808 [Amphibalanus amphitrite]